MDSAGLVGVLDGALWAEADFERRAGYCRLRHSHGAVGRGLERPLAGRAAPAVAPGDAEWWRIVRGEHDQRLGVCGWHVVVRILGARPVLTDLERAAAGLSQVERARRGAPLVCLGQRQLRLPIRGHLAWARSME